MSTFMILVSLAATALLFKMVHAVFFAKHPRRLPAGPKPKPLIGNILDMPSSYPEKVFAQWGEIYGLSD